MIMEPNFNRLLANRYKIKKLIGKGAMGIVYLAEDTLSNGLKVAVKFLSQALQNEKMLKKFEREARISALLSEKSNNIVKVKDYGLDLNGLPFYVMELLEGETLEDILNVDVLSLPRFLNLASQICFAMQSAHNGIIYEGELCPVIHRDIKPSNIFILKDPELGEVVKILDFGIAEMIEPDKSAYVPFMGTPEYSSPEQMEGKELDNRSDIYSFGLIMYEMLVNEKPFHASGDIGAWYEAHSTIEPKKFNEFLNLPPDLEKIIMKSLEKKITDRPQSVGEILQILQTLERKYKKKQDDKTLEIELSSDSSSSIEKIYLNSSWPTNKPLQKIVFPCVINFNDIEYPSLWAMLEEEDIMNRESSIYYNRFLFKSYPHPMVLWITGLYNKGYGARWLPCYLDLKSSIGQKVIANLSQSKFYHILLFALSKPDEYKNIGKIRLSMKQRSMLETWSKVGETLKVTKAPQVSKKKLKLEFEELKETIITKLQSSDASDGDVIND